MAAAAPFPRQGLPAAPTRFFSSSSSFCLCTGAGEARRGVSGRGGRRARRWGGTGPCLERRLLGLDREVHRGCALAIKPPGRPQSPEPAPLCTRPPLPAIAAMLRSRAIDNCAALQASLLCCAQACCWTLPAVACSPALIAHSFPLAPGQSSCTQVGSGGLWQPWPLSGSIRRSGFASPRRLTGVGSGSGPPQCGWRRLGPATAADAAAGRHATLLPAQPQPQAPAVASPWAGTRCRGLARKSSPSRRRRSAAHAPRPRWARSRSRAAAAAAGTLPHQLHHPPASCPLLPIAPTKQKVRDECTATYGPEDPRCAPLIEAHKVCLRKEGFNV